MITYSAVATDYIPSVPIPSKWITKGPTLQASRCMLKAVVTDICPPRSLSILRTLGPQVRKPVTNNNPTASKRSLSWADIVKI